MKQFDFKSEKESVKQLFREFPFTVAQKKVSPDVAKELKRIMGDTEFAGMCIMTSKYAGLWEAPRSGSEGLSTWKWNRRNLNN